MTGDNTKDSPKNTSIAQNATRRTIQMSRRFVIEGQDMIMFINATYTVNASSEEEAVEKVKEERPNFSVKNVYEI